MICNQAQVDDSMCFVFPDPDISTISIRISPLCKHAYHVTCFENDLQGGIKTITNIQGTNYPTRPVCLIFVVVIIHNSIHRCTTSARDIGFTEVARYHRATEYYLSCTLPPRRKSHHFVGSRWGAWTSAISSRVLGITSPPQE